MRSALALLLIAALSGCAIDALLFTELTRGSQVEVPGAGNNFLEGRSTALPGSSVTFFTSTGVALDDLATDSTADGVFTATLNAASQFDNLVVVVDDGARSVLGIVPRIQRKTSVLDADRTVVMGGAIASMQDLGVDSTVAALVVLGQVRYGDPAVPLAAISAEDTTSIIAELESLRDAGDGAVTPLYDQVGALFANAKRLQPFPGTDESFVSAGDNTGFESALSDAISALGGANTCFASDAIRVVIMVDFNDGNRDRNCAEIDRFQWAEDAPDRQMFMAGALHEDTPNCDTDPPPCLEPDVFDAFSVGVLGNFKPNVIAMYDDGTNGDLIAGDNVWTRAFEAPWFDAGAETNRWVRMHYKYTWGAPGQLWTSTEEWPGNSRLLELRDVNGDRIITRYDHFGDETSNKDKANLLAPARGGCGKVSWASDRPPEQCVNDVLENQIDTDDDCAPDTWPAPGTAAPVTESCTE